MGNLAGLSAEFADEGVTPRNARRLNCSVLCDLRPDGLRNVRIRLCDISDLGFMAECEEMVPLGGTVSIDMPGIGATHARIRWGMGGRIGGRFMQPIDVDACRTAIAEITSTT